MKERPILFSGPMVRAILEGRKTMTRRVVKPRKIELMKAAALAGECMPLGTEPQDWDYLADLCPFGIPGDRLWVRESWFQPGQWKRQAWPEADADDVYWVGERRAAYAAEQSKPDDWRSRPSIHMPRWASRITLEVTGVRVERLQDISEENAKAEGLKSLSKDGNLFKWGIPDWDGLPGNDNDGWFWADWHIDPRNAFQRLWGSINGPGSWDENPWVWCVEFSPMTTDTPRGPHHD